MLDRAISTKFLTHRVSLQSSYPNFQKKFCLSKNGGHFEFSNFSQKLQNIKMLISRKPLLVRAISTKILTYRVSLQSSHANFQKKFVSQKMAAILIFEFFAKLQNTKMLISRKPCYIERFRRNFWSSGYLCRAAIPKSLHLVKFQTRS